MKGVFGIEAESYRCDDCAAKFWRTDSRVVKCMSCYASDGAKWNAFFNENGFLNGGKRK